MELRELVTALRQRWVWPLAGLLVGVVVALGMSSLATPIYTSYEQFLVTTTNATTASEAYEGGQLAQQRVLSYAEILQGERLAGRVIDRLDVDLEPDEFVQRVASEVPIDTAVLNVSVTDGSAQRAQAMATTLGEEFVWMVAELEEVSGDASSIQLIQTEDATLPSSPSYPQPVRNVGVGLLTGLLIGSVVAVVRSRFDRTINDSATAAAAAGAPVVGVIENDKAMEAGRPLGRDRAVVPAGYRQLRNNLQILGVDRQPPRMIMIVGASPGEGSSTLVLNLALALTAAELRVAVVDTDLRDPQVDTLLELPRVPGLTDVVRDCVDLDAAVQSPEMDDKLFVLPAGTPVRDPDEVLASRRITLLLSKVKSEYDVVLIDAPPLLLHADAGNIAALADGVLLAVRHGHTTADQVQACRATLDRIGARTLGVVMNRAPARAASPAAPPYSMSGS